MSKPFDQRRILVDQNEEKLERLAGTVDNMKQGMLGLKKEFEKGDSVLIDIESGMGTSENLLSSNITHIGKLIETGSTKHTMYFALFVLAVFLALYWIFG